MPMSKEGKKGGGGGGGPGGRRGGGGGGGCGGGGGGGGGGGPTSHMVSSSRLSKAKFRKPERSIRKGSDRCWASSRMMRGEVPRSSTRCTRAFLMSVHSWARRWDGRTPISVARVRKRSSGVTA